MRAEIAPNMQIVFRQCGQGIQIVVERDRAPYVCRKSKLSELRNFLASGEDELFKGRLKLKRNGDEIAVFAKGEKIATLPESFLIETIESAESSKLENQRLGSR